MIQKVCNVHGATACTHIIFTVIWAQIGHDLEDLISNLVFVLFGAIIRELIYINIKHHISNIAQTTLHPTSSFVIYDLVIDL